MPVWAPTVAPHRNAVRWAGRAAGSIADQAFISGSNFLLTVTLARWLGPAKYGAYVMIFSVFMLLANVHQALVLEPMCVIQPSQYPESRAGYIGSVLRLHSALCGILTMLALAAAAIFLSLGQRDVAQALAGMALALPAVLLLWFARAGSYLDFASGPAAAASLFYSLTLLAGLIAAHHFAVLTPFTAFCLLGGASLAAAIALLVRLKPQVRNSRPGWREIAAAQWNYGRWSLGFVFVQWLQVNSFYLLAGWLLGMREAGVLGAITNLVSPSTQIFAATSRLILPYFSGLSRDGYERMRFLAPRIAFLFTGCAALYWVALSLLREPVFALIYARGYAGFAEYVPAGTFGVVLIAASFPYEMGLKAAMSPRSLVHILAAATLIQLAASVPAIRLYQLNGVLAARIGVGVVSVWLTIRAFRRQTGSARNGAAVFASEPARAAVSL